MTWMIPFEALAAFGAAIVIVRPVASVSSAEPRALVRNEPCSSVGIRFAFTTCFAARRPGATWYLSTCFTAGRPRAATALKASSSVAAPVRSRNA